MIVLVDIGRGLREGLFMFWETAWALVLGFTLSGAVQAFVSREQMQARLGDHGPRAVARASFFGMVSSSCSYAASAMTHSIVRKGADFTSAMIFMIASTNLVIELGIVMLVLLGWQFAVAEFVGGPIMIILLALVGGVVFTIVRRRPVADVDETAVVDRACATGVAGDTDETTSSIRSLAGWADASRYALADATMLRKELAIGYGVAGLLTAIVPTHLWNDLFWHGHGVGTSVENALVGPIIAMLSWVCSIGNVPLAAALWSGGIAFGGVIAFIFADLISMPLILIYRKFYGWRLTARMVLVFYAVMAVAGLATEGIFTLFHAVPRTRAVTVASAHFSWNYTTYLNLVFLALALGVWWLARHGERFGAGAGFAHDVVCAMQVRVADAPAQSTYQGTTYYFCSPRCRERFEANPERFVSPGASPQPGDDAPALDPVCHMSVDPATAADHRVYEGHDVWFCNVACAQRFDEDPTAYPLADRPTNPATSPLGSVALETRRTTMTAIDPVCHMSVDPATAADHRVYEGHDVWFCNVACAQRFDEDPTAYPLADA